MEWIFNSIWLLISLLFVLGILGLIAGFSPTLYAAQVGSGAHRNTGRRAMFGLMAGVLSAAIFLSILFQFFQLSTLVFFVSSTLHAVLVNAGFNLLVGGALIASGVWYLRHIHIRVKQLPSPRKGSGTTWTLAGFGFIRTCTSVSTITAVFAANSIIAEAGGDLLTKGLLLALFLAASLGPFLIIYSIVERHPEKITPIFARAEQFVKRIHYQRIASYLAITLGLVLIISSILRIIFR